MKTTLDFETFIFGILKPLNLAISGGVYLNKRVFGSKAEDVVINSLPVTNDNLQSAIVNVNIHVPNLKLNTNGQTDNTQPDRVRLNEIAAPVLEALNECYEGDFSCDVQLVTLIEEPENKEHYFNIRVQTIYKNN